MTLGISKHKTGIVPASRNIADKEKERARKETVTTGTKDKCPGCGDKHTCTYGLYCRKDTSFHTCAKRTCNTMWTETA